MKLVLAGPPHSGKSCFREGLKQALRKLGVYGYAITACPDGEGAWYQATAAADPALAAACKEEYKGSFSDAFVRRIEASVRDCSLPYTLVDIGGRTSPENEQICRHATAALILSSDPAKFAEWREFFADIGVPVVAEIVSDYNGTEDVTEQDGDVLKGVCHHLERGEDLGDRTAIEAVAKLMTETVGKEEA